MFVLSFLPLSTSGMQKRNGIEEGIILHINKNEIIDSNILQIINIELTIEQDMDIIL